MFGCQVALSLRRTNVIKSYCIDLQLLLWAKPIIKIGYSWILKCKLAIFKVWEDISFFLKAKLGAKSVEYPAPHCLIENRNHLIVIEIVMYVLSLNQSFHSFLGYLWPEWEILYKFTKEGKLMKNINSFLIEDYFDHKFILFWGACLCPA